VSIPPLTLQKRKPLLSIIELRSFALTLSREVARRRPGLLHANGAQAVLGCLRAARKTNTPLIWHVRDVAMPKMLGRMAARRAAAVIAISQTVREALGSLCPAGCPPEVVYDGIDTDELRPAIGREAFRGSMDVSDNRPVILFAAQLVDWKRPELALGIFAGVRQHVDAQLWIAGDPPPGDHATADRLQALSQSLGVADAIRLLGYRTDMPDVMNAADLLLATARCEPLGRSVMEAMAMGRPVAATNEGGHRELIENGVSGLLFDAGRVEDGVAAVLRLLGDASESARIGEAARTRIEQDFPVATMVERVQKIYDRVLRG